MTKGLRADLRNIAEEIPAGSRVLDLGCGDGTLLAWLRDERGCEVRGVELDENHVVEAVGRGVPVVRSDLDEGLWMFPDDAFDIVVLSQALQEVRRPAALLREILRVGDHALVSFPNFGHWGVRLYLLFRGRMPVSRHIPYSWHETPSIHHTTILDFNDLVDQVGGVVEGAVYLRTTGNGVTKRLTLFPHWRAQSIISYVGHKR
jgi:methionine biosynthesis protein MetW